MKVAIVYDWMDKWGGVERVLLYLHELFPTADFYTSYIDRQTASWAKDIDVKTSFIQNLPAFIKKSRLLSLPLYPYAFESFDFSEYKLVISVTSSFAKGIITKPSTFHLCYLLTPTRYIWGQQDSYLKGIKSMFSLPFTRSLREWDFIAAQRPDKIVSISQTVADRCLKYYQRQSEVIYPPFDSEYWGKIKPQHPVSNIQIPKEYYLVVSRLEPYKKVDIAVDVFNTLTDKQLIIVGSGREKQSLMVQAGKNIQFLENISDEELAYLYSHAQAFIMPQEEDFGYGAIEAQFFGCPVIAYGKGGALETMENGKIGIFFEHQSSESLRSAVERFKMITYNGKGSKFDKTIFKKQFLKALPL